MSDNRRTLYMDYLPKSYEFKIGDVYQVVRWTCDDEIKDMCAMVYHIGVNVNGCPFVCLKVGNGREYPRYSISHAWGPGARKTGHILNKVDILCPH